MLSVGNRSTVIVTEVKKNKIKSVVAITGFFHKRITMITATLTMLLTFLSIVVRPLITRENLYFEMLIKHSLLWSVLTLLCVFWCPTFIGSWRKTRTQRQRHDGMRQTCEKYGAAHPSLCRPSVIWGNLLLHRKQPIRARRRVWALSITRWTCCSLSSTFSLLRYSWFTTTEAAMNAHASNHGHQWRRMIILVDSEREQVG